MGVDDTDVRTLYSEAIRAAEQYGSKAAIVHYGPENQNEPEIISYRHVLARVTQAINWLHSKGVNEGDVVAFFLPNCPEKIIIDLAAKTLGISLAIEYYQELSAVEDVLKKTQPKVVIFADQCLDPRYFELYQSIQSVIESFASVFYLRRKDTDVAKFSRAQDLILELPSSSIGKQSDVLETLECRLPSSIERAASYCFTGGTSGKPKVVVRSVKNLFYSEIEASRVLNSSDRLDERSTVFSLQSHFTQFFLAGATVLSLDESYIAGGNNGLSIGDFFVKQQLTHLVAPFPLVQRFMHYPKFKMACKGSLKTITHYGAKLTVNNFRQLKAIGFETVLDSYGSMETSLLSSYAVLNEASLGKIGKLRECFEMKIATVMEGEHLTECVDGEIGQLLVRGPSVFECYLFEETIKASLIGDWYETGDLVRIDENGDLWLVGRDQKFARLGATYSDLEGMEERVLNYDDVDSIAVIPACDVLGRLVLTVFACPAPGITIDKSDFQAYCCRELQPEKFFTDLEVSLVALLPRLARGKIDRIALQRIALKRIVFEHLNKVDDRYTFEVEVIPDEKHIHCLEIRLSDGSSLEDDANTEIYQTICQMLSDFDYSYKVF